MYRGLAVALMLAALFAATALAAVREGGRGPDRLVGTKGNDILRGRGGPDVLRGGRGDDVLIGGRGNDVLRGGPGRDSFNMRDGVELASPGNDKIYARDGEPDEINCGAGYDVAVVDAEEDGVIDCERIIEP